ncbi:MAG: DUF5777 family beta-barrel protein, partial [Bacteroidota bacterium]
FNHNLPGKNYCMKAIMSLVLLLLSLPFVSLAQDDLLALLEEGEAPEANITPATFKGSRLINGHTVMTRRAGTLEFLIAHRFGRLNSGAYELFGIDQANVRFGLEYGISDRLTLGFGRNSFEKTYDGFVKLAILRQQKGKRQIPVSITGLATTAIKTLKPDDENETIAFSSRLTYSYQLLVARKFGKQLSLQLMPTMLHRNEITLPAPNDLFALGAGGRFKLNQRLSINAEYYYRLNAPDTEEFKNSLAIGVDIETGGHVFQLHLTNSRAMNEKGFISETRGNFFEGDIHFGFNVTRVF